jgi:SOS-response transcriptional repressor LexA
MREELIGGGDFVVVRPCNAPDHGTKVVAWLKDLGGVLKVYDKGKNQLHSGSGKGRWVRALDPQDILLGVLVGVIRKC